MDTEGLSIICAGIGCLEEDENGALVGYTKGEYCLDSLKDLQRFLRRDNPQRRDVFKQICKWNILSRDLVPLIEHYQSDRNLLISAVKILVFMTMPVDHSSDNVAQQIEYLWDLKASLARSVTIAVIVSLIEDPLDHLEHNTFAEDDWKLVQLVLTLFRNILAIHDITQQQKSAGLATQYFCLADRFLELMFEENVMDLIIVLTQHVNDSSSYLQQDNLLFLEIFNCIFLGRDPELIARVSKQANKVNEDISTTIDSLSSIMEEEEKRRTIHLRNFERPSQFSGTFTLLGVDGSKTVLKRHPTSVSGNGMIKIHNVQRGPLKRIVWDHDNLHPGKKNILELLNGFLNQFVPGGYNVLMQSIYADITKESLSIQKAEIMMFFRVAKFVLAFQHQKILISKEPNMEEPLTDLSYENLCGDKATFHGEVCGPVAATMNEAMLNFVISKWLETFDGLKQTNDYKSLSTIGSLFKSMICMLDLVLKVSLEGSKETQVARVLLYKLFYDQTDQGLTHFLLTMFKSFNSHKQPKSDLADLLEVIHVMLRLMEKLQGRGALRVARKSRKGRRKEKPKGTGSNEAAGVSEHMNLKNDVDQADETRGHSSETFVEPNSLINKQLTKLNETDEDIVQEVMPLSDQAADVATNKRDIGDDMVPSVGEIENADFIEVAHEPVDFSSDDHLPDTNEVDFNITKLVATFVNNCVISNLCWLLKYYKCNSAGTNHYIICMLQRICDDLDISPMLYQLSILRVFYDILADQKSSKSKKHSNIVNFITKFIRKMLKLMKERPLLFVEILFWKTRRECHCITADALLANVSDLQKDANKHHDDTFLRTNTRPKSIADSLGDDEFILPSDFNNLRDDNSYDELHENRIDQTKKKVGEQESMRSISIDNLEMDRRSKNIKVPKPYKGFIDQEQEITIRNLYDKYKGEKRCSHLIAEALDPDGNITPVQVYRKLKQLGLHTVKKKNSSGVNASISAVEDPTEEAKEKEYYQGAALHKRKRAQTFSKDQELKVKILFERFKHHEKCSHMIAEALDANKTYSAIQVSHKLKQLGLVAPKGMGSLEIRNQARDEDNGCEGLQLEEKETLLAIKQRCRNKKSKLSTSEKATHESVSLLHKVTPRSQDSDEETLATLLKSRVPRQLEESLEDPVSIDQNLEDEMDTGSIPSALDDDDDDVVMKREFKLNYDDAEEEMYTSAPQKAGHKRNLKLVYDEEDD